jgi:integrase
MSQIRSRKRPCKICRKWFLPDVRQAGRQKTCSAGCRRELHRRSCAEWNTLTTHLLEHNVPVYRIAQLIGHADESQTTGRYGKRFEPDKLKAEVIDKINFKVDLSHLKKSRFVR